LHGGKPVTQAGHCKRATQREGEVVHSLGEDWNMLESVAALAFILILGLLYVAFAADE
jgi:hypothetical protein